MEPVTSMAVPMTLAKELKIMAAHKGQTIKALLVEAVTKYLSENK